MEVSFKQSLEDPTLAGPAEETQSKMLALFALNVNINKQYRNIKEVECLLAGPKIESSDACRLLDFLEAYRHMLAWKEFGPVSEGKVKMLHSIVMKHNASPDIPVGMYKTRDVTVGGCDTTSVHLVKGEMDSLLAALNLRLQEICNYEGSNIVEPLIRLAASFFVRLLKIHPFAAGNGRVGRLLLSHLLLPITRFFPFNFLADRGVTVLNEDLLYSKRLCRFFLQDAGRPEELSAAICEGVCIAWEVWMAHSNIV